MAEGLEDGEPPDGSVAARAVERAASPEGGGPVLHDGAIGLWGMGRVDVCLCVREVLG